MAAVKGYLMNFFVQVFIFVLMWKTLALKTFGNSCPDRCNCSQRFSSGLKAKVLTVNCSYKNLKNAPLGIPSKTQSLFLSGNRFIDIFNKLPELPQLMELDLSRNNIKRLGRGTIFQNFAHLKVLDLSNNKFKTLFNGVFRGIHRLERLTIANGYLKFIDERVFEGMKILRYLNLKNNQIHSIAPEWFLDMVNLEILEIDHNEISYISSGTFSSLANLLNLSLTHNRIRGMSDNAFVGLQKLKSVFLGNNYIKHVPSTPVHSLKKLKMLNLDSNPIPILYTQDFVNLSVVEVSVSNSTTLTLIDEGAFWDLPSLESIHLQNNYHLQFIDPKAFIKVPNLHFLNLNNNNISAISENIVKQRTNVQISLSGNPLLCDCNLRWIREALDNSSTVVFKESDNLLCKQPEEVSNKRLQDLNLENIPIKCAPVLVGPVNQTVEKTIGEFHIFECRAFGNPSPSVYWILPSGKILNDTTNDIHIHMKQPETFVIFHLKPKDSGVYLCVAENVLGQAVGAIHLLVHSIDINIFPQRVSSTFVTVVWNGTARNTYPEYDLLYCIEGEKTDSYETVTVSYIFRSYTINNLQPETTYKICIAVKDDEGENLKLSCTHVKTQDANFIMQGIQTTSNVAIAVVLGIISGMVIIICFVSVAARKYRQRHYETPQKSLISNMAHGSPPENVSSLIVTRTEPCLEQD
ncbi:leucine-rich repeat neuronal protein 1-like [Tachypleus tridentatus]|uniref:leucine-rich repeat neuronal protein 1-like n=1 Tax=Tachypleus tridentatus TaxID=6853 RepID=UPI003FD4E83E